MFDTIKRDRIYKHDFLDQATADRFKPLMESAFAESLKAYDNRPAIKNERIRFMAEQYANRCRVSKARGVSPLNEDAAIFGAYDPSLTKLFEDVSAPGNIINMGNVRNPMNATDVPNGMWNPGYKPGTGDIPSYVFGLQNQLAVHCVGFDLLPVIAVDTPKPVIIYVDTVYGGGVFDDNENLPSFIEITNDLFTRSWINDSTTHPELVRHTTEVILYSKTTKKAVKVLFYLGSTIKPAMTVEVVATGTVTTEPDPSATPAVAGVYTWDNSVSVKDVIDKINDEHGYVVIEGADAATTYKSSELTTQFYINYASATRTNITEAATNNRSLEGMNRETQEKGPKHKLNVIAIDKQEDIVGFEIEADTTNIQIKDMAAMGISVISYLYNGVQNQLIQSMDDVICNYLYALGVEHAVNAYLSQGIDYNLYIGDPSDPSDPTTYLNIADLHIPFKDMNGVDRSNVFNAIPSVLQTTAYENQMTHNERLYRRILLISEFIKQDCRIAPADSMVVSGELAAAIKGHSTFIISPTANTINDTNDSMSYYGTIYGSIHIYKNNKIPFNDPRILLLRRGDDTDPGAKLLAYDLASSRQIVAERTMAEKIRVWSRFKVVSIGFYPELNYFTFVAVNKYKFA